MSKIQLEMTGLDELRKALQQLPEQLASEAADIVLAHAEQAQREIQQDYPVRTGTLQARVTVLKNRALVSTSALVRSRAPHAWIFEHGTRTRRTDKGSNRGKMPQAPTAQQMIPKVMRIRMKMVRALTALVRSVGFDVKESA